MSELAPQNQTNGSGPAGIEPQRPERPSDFYDESWLGSLLRPVLLVLMVLCINLALDVFLRQYGRGLGDPVRWTMLALGLVAAVVGVTTTTWLAHPNQRLQRSIGYRTAEIVLLLLVARLALWLAQGQLPNVEAFLYHPDEVFFDGPYLLTLIAMLFTWFAAIDFTDDMMQLALQPDELRMAAERQFGADTSRPAQTDRSVVLRRFVARWVGWGILLILIASALRLGITRAKFWTLARQDVDLAVITVILLYFICGLLLISQGQLAVLRSRWTRDRLPIGAGVMRNWPIYTLVVLVAIGLLASVLPLGDTMPIATVLGWILDVLYAIVTTIFQLISLLLILLFSLIPAAKPEQPIEPPPPAAAQQPPPLPPMVIPPWVSGALFWTTIIFILCVAAYFYFADKDANMLWLKRVLAALRVRWAQMWGAWRGWQKSLRGVSAGDALQQAINAPARSWWPLRWGRLSPEQRVRYLYFQMLDEAAEHNKGRENSETPNAYAPRLSQAIAGEAIAGEASAGEQPGGEQPVGEQLQPGAPEAIRALTDAFVQVRYAGQAVEQGQVSWLAQVWERLRKLFGAQP